MSFVLRRELIAKGFSLNGFDRVDGAGRRRGNSRMEQHEFQSSGDFMNVSKLCQIYVVNGGRMDLFDVIYSVRAQRKFLSEPVPDSMISQLLDAAIRAPSAGNRQEWLFVILQDSEQRRKIATIYEKSFGRDYGVLSSAWKTGAYGRRCSSRGS
jgi:nitroreductase family protein